LKRERLRLAQRLLETTNDPIEVAARLPHDVPRSLT
jgi:transcriptional regulator GlxA family with amidase domain